MNKQEAMTAVATIATDDKPVPNGNLKQKISPVFVEAEKLFEKFAEITRETALKAYDFFQRRGGEFGKEVEDWFNAESKILQPVPVEVTQTDGTITVNAAVPGFTADEIEISVKGDVLMMSGKSEKREEKKDENVFYSDWESNRFFRQLTLPSEVDADNVKAELKDGILRLTLPKAVTKEVKQIAVKAANQ